ncbi:MAG: hypothetical protein HQ582_33525 [Planctomycetes bacterium]|nr:hypothetical protein [Planctomycetota bacterium]
MRRLALWCIVILTPCSVARGAGDGSEALQLAREAVLAAEKTLKTGSAKGTYRWYGAEKELVLDISFHGAFDGPKYYLNLTYHPLRPGVAPEFAKRIVVHDGSGLFVSRFSERINPMGAEGEIRGTERGAVYAATDGFMSDIRSLVDGMLSVEEIDEHDVQMERLPNGHYRGRYEIKGNEYYKVFEIAPEYGYNAVLYEYAGDVPVHYSEQFIIGWKKTDHGWYVSSLESEKRGEGKLRRRRELHIEEFQPNVPVSADLFMLKALELPAGARMLERRSTEGPRAYEFADKEGKTDQEQMDRLVEQVEAMPDMYKVEEVQSGWGRRVWGVVFGVLGIVAIAAVWFASRKYGTNKGS